MTVVGYEKVNTYKFIARIHSQFESLGFVGKYDQSPTKLVNIEIRGSGFSAKSSV
jgi:hypothetical protein